MKNKTKMFIWTILILLFAVVVFSIPLLRLAGDFLIVSDEPQKADLITAVSGPEYRIIYAAEQYSKGLGKTLFFTGGFSEENQRYEASWSKFIAMNNGVPEESIVIDETTVISTYQEAVRLKEFVDANPDTYHSIIVVTDPYHTRRAKWTYQKVLGEEIDIQMLPVPFNRTGYTKNWWMNAYSRKLVWNEYLKFSFYLFRYQIATGSFRQWLAKFDQF